MPDQASCPWIELDWARFDPWRVQPVRHRLPAHPDLAMDAIVRLGQRLEGQGRIRKHSSDATPETPFNNAPGLHPHRRSAGDTLADIANARAWMSLLNIQTDPQYRDLVDSVLGSIADRIEPVDPGISYRGGWIFVTSPRTVTPFHMDREHNFILQVQGRKRILVWEPDDTEAVSEAARDLFHDTHSRDLVRWRESLRSRAHVFEVEPGMGVYMPSTAPHLVENGDGPSVTISFTYYTAATRRNSVVHRVHHRLRRAGLNPPPVGRHGWQDALAWQAGRAALGLQRFVRRHRGGVVIAESARYAEQTVT